MLSNIWCDLFFNEQTERKKHFKTNFFPWNWEKLVKKIGDSFGEQIIINIFEQSDSLYYNVQLIRQLTWIQLNNSDQIKELSYDNF